VGLALFALALIPRALALGGFLTADEAYHWFSRARLFIYAFSRRDYAHTNLVGHPGVTTMWLGGLGDRLFAWLAETGRAGAADQALDWALMRLPVALATAACVGLAYPLLRRLFGERVALLAGLLWAADPFLVAHSQLLHVDALLTSLVTLALLYALVAFGFDLPAGERPPRPRRGHLAASAVCGGLALLTKSPALVLLPMIGLIAGLAALDGRRTKGEGPTTNDQRPTFGTVLTSLALWAGVAALVWVALWPAAWLGVPQAVASIFLQAEADGGSPHGWGNFFLGQTVADPGPLFYPVALAFRLTPWTLVGLLAGAAALLRGGVRRGRAALLVLLLFALGFTVLMSIPPKKFDRYLLPVFPTLDLLAAVGLLWLGQGLTGLVRSGGEKPPALGPQHSPSPPHPLTPSPRRPLSSALAWLAAVLALGGNLLWYHPYELAYYNPLLGGPVTAVRTIPVGWGEGYEQAAAFINARPDGRDRPVATWFEPVLRPFVAAGTVPMIRALEPGQAGYAVLYIDQLQRRNVPQAIDALYGKVAPAGVVRIHGIDYAYIYQLPPPVAHPLDARFGPSVRLAGYDFSAEALRASGALTLTLDWQALQTPPADYMLFVHVLDSAGAVVARADLAPSGHQLPTSAWPPGFYDTLALRLPAPADLAPGRYWISLGLYGADGARLPLGQAPPPGAPDDGADALLLPVQVP
jgi:4-amino-4-deoxy-L-arabinose transferase-like glycosyltransferase